MNALLGTVGFVVTTMISYMTELVAFVTGQPLLLIGLGLMLAGAAVGFLSRLIRTV